MGLGRKTRHPALPAAHLVSLHQLQLAAGPPRPPRAQGQQADECFLVADIRRHVRLRFGGCVVQLRGCVRARGERRAPLRTLRALAEGAGEALAGGGGGVGAEGGEAAGLRGGAGAGPGE